MDKQREGARIKNGIKILFWLGLLAFFVYSLRTTMEFTRIAAPRAQERFIHDLTALSKPDFSDGEINRIVATTMWETIRIAFLATTISAVFAMLFTFFSARPSSFWSRGFNILLQPILSAIRAVHPLNSHNSRNRFSWLWTHSGCTGSHLVFNSSLNRNLFRICPTASVLELGYPLQSTLPGSSSQAFSCQHADCQHYWHQWWWWYWVST